MDNLLNFRVAIKSRAGRQSLAWAALLVLLLAAGCQARSPIVGRWRTNGPSNLLFEYRSDGTVRMVEPGRSFQVFRYQLQEHDTIRLYDGMGRPQFYQYRIEGDEMTYYLTTSSGIEVKETFRKEK